MNSEHLLAVFDFHEELAFAVLEFGGALARLRQLALRSLHSQSRRVQLPHCRHERRTALGVGLQVVIGFGCAIGQWGNDWLEWGFCLYDYCNS